MVLGGVDIIHSDRVCAERQQVGNISVAPVGVGQWVWYIAGGSVARVLWKRVSSILTMR